MTLVIISDKGQITIPSKIRRKLNLRPRTLVDIDIKDNEIRARPVKSVEEVAGIFEEAAKGKSTDYDEIQKQAMAKMAKEFVKGELS